ncbi:hypothetical protein [Pseudoalteromonas lipolytica]
MKVAVLAMGLLLANPITLTSAIADDFTSQGIQELKFQDSRYDDNQKVLSSRWYSNKSTISMKSTQDVFEASATGYTASELTQGQYALIEDGNDNVLPPSGVGLYFNIDGSGFAGFDFSGAFSEEKIEWQIVAGDIEIISSGKTTEKFDNAPYDRIAQRYGQDLADFLNNKFENNALDYRISYSEFSYFDVAVSRGQNYHDYNQVSLTGTDYYKLIVPQEWGWNQNEISRSESFESLNKLYNINNSNLSDQVQSDIAGRWLLSIPRTIYSPLSDNYIPGVFADTLTLNEDGTVVDTLSGNSYQWSSSEGVIELASGNSRYEITPFISINKAHLSRVEQYENNELTRVYVATIAKYDNSYGKFTENLSLPLPNVWNPGINLYYQEDKGDKVNVDYLYGYRFLDNNAMWRGASFYTYDEHSEITYDNRWTYKTNGRLVTTQREYDSSFKRVRYWDTLSVDAKGTAVVLEYSFLYNDLNNDGVFSDNEIDTYILPRLNTMMKVDLSSYQPWEYLADSDNDGLKDIHEEELGTDPYYNDSDFDGLSDSEEVRLGTDPLSEDSDGDGYSDWFELQVGSDPLDIDSVPGSKTSFFEASNLFEVKAVLTNEVQPGRLHDSGTGLNFHRDGTAHLGENISGSFGSRLLNWTVENGQIVLRSDDDATVSSTYYYYPFENIENSYGSEVAQWLRNEVDAGRLDNSVHLQVIDKVNERRITKHENDKVIYIIKSVRTLNLPETWNYEGEIKSEEYTSAVISRWEDGISSTLTGMSTLDVQGKWLAFLKYDVTYGAARGIGTEPGVYADNLGLQNSGDVKTENTSLQLKWMFEDGAIKLTGDNEQIVITPFRQVRKNHLAYYEVYSENNLSYVYIAPLAKYDNSYTAFTNNIVTTLPEMQFAGINANYPSAWTNGQLNFNEIFGYQFRADGTLRRGIGGNGYDDNQFIYMGNIWNYSITGNRIQMSYVTESQERERVWDVVSVDASGIALVYERSRFDYDSNGDGVISDDERGIFIAPRLNKIEKIDLSTWETPWNKLPDSDNDGLNDYIEEDLGTNLFNSDSDHDGIPDLEEVSLGTNPTLLDSDGDGFSDYFEINQGSDPLNYDSIPASTTFRFDENELIGKDIAITLPSKEGWLEKTGFALHLNNNFTGKMGSNWVNNYLSSSIYWGVVEGNIVVDNVEAQTFYSDHSYPFDNIRSLYGNEIADWLVSQVENGVIPEDFRFDELREVSKLVLSPYSQTDDVTSVIVSFTYKMNLIIPEEWGYTGELPSYSHMNESIYNWQIDLANIFASFSKSEITGEWLLFAPNQLENSYSSQQLAGIYADTLALGDNGVVQGGYFDNQYQWSFDEQKVVLTENNKRIEVLPYKQLGKQMIAFHKVFESGELVNVYIAPVAKFDQTYVKSIDNLVTDLPIIQFAGINAHLESQWNKETLLLENVYGYHFKNNGSLRRGVGGLLNYSTGELSLTFGQDWTYSIDGNRVTLRFESENYMRERTWEFISSDSNNRSLVFEHSWVAYDENGDGELTDDEFKNLIAPRINILMPFDLSHYEEWKNLDDSDGDGLKDIQENDLGTDIYNSDSDQDGINDYDEFKYGLDPLNPSDAAADADGDGLSNIDEILFSTDVNNPDTDGDGVNDGDEIRLGTNPLDSMDTPVLSAKMLMFSDVNGDGVSDWIKFQFKDAIIQFYLIDGTELTEFNHFEFSHDLSAPSVELLTDRNNDGVKEIGLFGFNKEAGRYQLYVYSGDTGQGLGVWNWPNTLEQVEFKAIADLTGDGVEEYAITGIHTLNGGRQLVVKDGVTKKPYQTFKWVDLWLQPEIVVMSDITGDNVPEVALYGRHKRMDKGQLFMLDGMSAEKRDVYNWNKLWTELSLHEMDDLDGDGTIDWGQFGTRKDDGRYQWVVKKGHDKRGVIRTFSWPNDLTEVKPLLIADRTGDGVREVSVYGKSDDGRVYLRVNDGRLANTRIANFSWPAMWQDEEVMELGDLNNDGYTEVGLLGVNKNSGVYQLIIKDGFSTVEYGRLTLDGEWAKLTIHSYDVNSDGFADIVVNGIENGERNRVLNIFSGHDLKLLNSQVH